MVTEESTLGIRGSPTLRGLTFRALCAPAVSAEGVTFTGECKSKELHGSRAGAEATAENFHTYVRSHWGIREQESLCSRHYVVGGYASGVYRERLQRVMATLRNLAAGIPRLNGVGDIKRTTERIARDRYRRFHCSRYGPSQRLPRVNLPLPWRMTPVLQSVALTKPDSSMLSALRLPPCQRRTKASS